MTECAKVAKPDGVVERQGALKALSARVLRAVPNETSAHSMRAMVLSGFSDAWEGQAGARSAAELKEAATHFERAGVLTNAPAAKAQYASLADRCRSLVAGV